MSEVYTIKSSRLVCPYCDNEITVEPHVDSPVQRQLDMIGSVQCDKCNHVIVPTENAYEGYNYHKEHGPHWHEGWFMWPGLRIEDLSG